MSKIQRLRDQLYLLQGSRCFYCDHAIAPSERSLEHVVPSSDGGLADADNAVVVCEAANQLLGCATPKQKMIMLKSGGGTIECPKKCVHTSVDACSDDVYSPRPAMGRVPVNASMTTSRETSAAHQKPVDGRNGETSSASTPPLTAKQKHKARSGHQSLPRPASGRRR